MKIKRILTFILFICSLATGYSSVNDSLKISLVTCSPGFRVYELFGHTGLRVQDPSRHIDVVFHYGVFSFNTPNFIYRFTKGETDYSIGLVDFKDFVYSYAIRGSKITELPLNLTPEESGRIFQALIINNMPDNRIYRYNFLYDNCATRPRNMITENLSGELQYAESRDTLTFREMIHSCTRNYPWLTFGIDLALGSPLDYPITYKEQMFLPDVLMDAFEKARVIGADTIRRLSGDPVLILPADPVRMAVAAEKQPLKITPLMVTSLFLLLIMIISVIEILICCHCRIVDTVLFSVYGLVGCLLFFLMFVSTHPATYPNYSCFWANPFLLILPVIIWVKSMKKIVYYYHFVNFAVLLCLLLWWYWLPQQMNIAFLPLVLVLVVRSVTYIWIERKKVRIVEKGDVER
ncbi:lipoprotein N-acyltransferase Lnb domain-containing protein [Coprobacter sp.]